jgi:hypothetical protein
VGKSEHVMHLKNICTAINNRWCSFKIIGATLNIFGPFEDIVEMCKMPKQVL